MDFLEDIATAPSNRICVECLSLLDGDETFSVRTVATNCHSAGRCRIGNMDVSALVLGVGALTDAE